VREDNALPIIVLDPKREVIIRWLKEPPRDVKPLRAFWSDAPRGCDCPVMHGEKVW
jgi:hypothetical protein